jgi:hypothetical protein
MTEPPRPAHPQIVAKHPGRAGPKPHLRRDRPSHRPAEHLHLAKHHLTGKRVKP